MQYVKTYTLKPWYNEPRYSEFCHIVNKPYFHFEDLLSNIKMYIKTSPTYNMSTITKSNCMHFFNFKSMICGHILNKMSYISSNIFKDIFPTQSIIVVNFSPVNSNDVVILSCSCICFSKELINMKSSTKSMCCKG